LVHSKASPSRKSLKRLSANELGHYQREGYLVLRNVFRQPEIDALALDAQRVCDEYADLVDVHNLRVRFKPHHETGSPIFEVFDPLSDLSSVAKAITADRRILDLLHDLYGEPAELFKDKLIYKPPGATGATLHQDWIAWPGFPTTFLTVLVAIDPFTTGSGATEVYPRVHQQGYLSPCDGHHHALSHDALATDPVPLSLEPGDIALFSCFTPHRSAPNREAKSRRGYFISYNARSDGGDQYREHYRQFHDWIRTKSAEPTRSLLYFR
jgi:2-aminoethylphosphonate dioxygenase